jgi:hypothetical protein
MPVITICVTFNMGGTAAINVIPSTHDQWEPDESACKDYDLPKGDYEIPYITGTMSGGSIDVSQNGEVKDQADLNTGSDGGTLHITVI